MSKLLHKTTYVCDVNVAYYIGKKIQSSNGSFVKTIANVTVMTVAIGVSLLIVTYSILGGFKQTIREKLVSFDSHIQLKKYELTDAFITSPLVYDSTFYKELQDNPQIASVNTYGLSAGIMQKNNEVAGVVFKGVNKDYNFGLFNLNLLEGRAPSFEDKKEVMLSLPLVKKFDVSVGDQFVVYFFTGKRPKPRKFTLVGVFETGLEEIDSHFMLGDIQMLRNVSNWSENEVGGYELFLNDLSESEQVKEEVEFSNSAYFDTEAVLITDKYQYIFQWLEMIDQNAVILVIIIFIIVFFNLLSTMYILVIDRTSAVGILKAMGGGNVLLAQVFWFSSIRLVLKGLLFGNVVGVAFCLIQLHFQVIPLDPENYYMSAVPIMWDWFSWSLINLVTLLAIGLVISIPIISTIKMKPIKAIRFN
ncbi:ABC transporter permease [Cyclobacteriaceae bacterium]|nr:ABC transporter permease [Cyclobacteriaceae bacterium]